MHGLDLNLDPIAPLSLVEKLIPGRKFASLYSHQQLHVHRKSLAFLHYPKASFPFLYMLLPTHHNNNLYAGLEHISLFEDKGIVVQLYSSRLSFRMLSFLTVTSSRTNPLFAEQYKYQASSRLLFRA